MEFVVLIAIIIISTVAIPMVMGRWTAKVLREDRKEDAARLDKVVAQQSVVENLMVEASDTLAKETAASREVMKELVKTIRDGLDSTNGRQL